MKIAAVVSKPAKPELGEIVPEVLGWLTERGYRVYLDQETATYQTNEFVVPRTEISRYQPEFVLVLGGDGTLLSAARAVGASGIPLLAVNLGSLGFLTEVRLDELYDTLSAAVEGTCPFESRSLLECILLRDGQEIARYHALNDPRRLLRAAREQRSVPRLRRQLRASWLPSALVSSIAALYVPLPRRGVLCRWLARLRPT